MSKRIVAAVAILVLITAGLIWFVAMRPSAPRPTGVVPFVSPSGPSSNQTSTKPPEAASSTQGPTANLTASSTIDATRESFSSTADIFVNSSTWATFTDPEDFYSIQYPNLGSFVVQYSPVPLKTTLGWRGKGDFDVSIWTVSPESGLHLQEWLKKTHNLDVSSTTEDIQTLTVNGMDCVLVLRPDGHIIDAYLEQDFFEEPLIHQIEFTSYTYQYTYPPFWKTMLETFQQLPWQG